ncbi:MAG: hypothetical protein KBC94_14650 [Pseudacidovorax sp.]|uniref:hypothetical protein n=1 Tax=Pseudacidovorax sp. TaxID=1934311 RepID=UPI001B656D3F|nr:hypothetical protein [Pseudacidovorax sp.]MBP6895657.1 hypothetical protein [Pseudacidovorax sp.]
MRVNSTRVLFKGIKNSPKFLTAKQLFKEFYIPFGAAAAWTTFSKWNAEFSVTGFLQLFGPTFFFFSWLTAQVFRVKKQASVEQNLKTIEQKVADSVQQLELHAKKLINYSTGGDSYCYFSVMKVGATLYLTAIHVGEFPLFNVVARVTDLYHFNTLLKSGGHLPDSDRHVKVGDLTPGFALGQFSVVLHTPQSQDVNIFFTARNGEWVQELRFREVNGEQCFVNRVTVNGNVEHQVLSGAYPISSNGTPEGL